MMCGEKESSLTENNRSKDHSRYSFNQNPREKLNIFSKKKESESAKKKRIRGLDPETVAQHMAAIKQGKSLFQK